MNKHSFLKTVIIFISIIALICIFYTIRDILMLNMQRKQSLENGFLSWSANDSIGNSVLLGIRSSDVFKRNNNSVFAIDSLSDINFFGLRYPTELSDIVYCTTTNLQTGEECIVSIKSDEPRFTKFIDYQSNQEISYYKCNKNYNILLSRYGKITYKKVVEQNIYYCLETKTDGNIFNKCEIRKFNMTSLNDELIVSNVKSKSSFDVNKNNHIAYIDECSDVIINKDGVEIKVADDSNAVCFVDDNASLVTTLKSIKKINLENNSHEELYQGIYGYQIALSPSGLYAAIVSEYENPLGQGIKNDKLIIIG